MDSIFVKETGKYGRGVFAKRNIKKGELIEVAPVIIIQKDEWEKMQNTILSNYIFRWKDHKAIVLGYGSLYNHSYRPNAKYITNFTHFTIDFYARTDIKKGEEIRVNYNGEPDDQTPVWFEVIDETRPSFI